MNDLNSTKALAWTSVLEELAKKATSELGKSYCLNLPFAQSYEHALQLQKQTSEALHLFDTEGNIPIGGLRNIKKSLEDIAKGIILTGINFLDISSTLKSVRNLKRFITNKLTDDKELYLLVFPLYTNQDLEIEIDVAFSSDGTMQDSASQALGKIRHSMRQTQQNIKDNLTKMLQDSKYKNIIQETIITQRNGRYVIPVRAEAQSSIKGIVQDQSISGSTVYLEPMSIVEDNNKLARKIVEERVEIEKILRELGEKIAPDIEAILETIERMAEFDSIIAKAQYGISINAKKPHINDKGIIDLHKVKHPLLIKQRGEDNVTPIDFLLGKTFDAMIITGSNTGGKTVTLKTLGLCVLMVKAGLYLPTKTESEIGFFEKVLADIGDEQSIEQNLSTFSGHLININNIINHADQKSLILLDEVGTGTDPTEGAAIAQAIIEALIERKAKIVVTTHYGELKTMAFHFPSISNASVEFNVETLSPTYKLLIGVPGKSNAIYIAQRLGVNEKTIIRAKELLKGEEQDVAASIENLEKEYKKLITERNRFEELNHSLGEKEILYNQKFEELEAKKKKIRDNLYESFEADISSSMEEIRQVVRDLQRDKNSQNAENSRLSIENVGKKFKNKYRNQLEAKVIVPKDDLEINVGDYFYLEKIRQLVQVISLKDKKIEVQAGPLKLTIDKSELTKVEGNELKLRVKSLKNRGISTKIKIAPRVQTESYRNSFNECDLRGLYVEEALEKVSKFIDGSSLTGANTLYIIHGKGSGALRNAVRDYLKRTSYIDSFRSGETNEGGEGISVVYLKG